MAALFEKFGPEAESILLLGNKTARNGLLVQSFTGSGFRDESAGDTIRLCCRMEELQNTDIVRIISE